MRNTLPMSSSKDLEQRVSAVEAEVAVARKEAAAARTLAGGADRDVADFRVELRGHGRVLGALRETQLEMWSEMLQMQSDMLEMRDTQLRHYAEHKADTAELKAEMKAGMTQIVRMLDHLIDNDRGTGA